MYHAKKRRTGQIISATKASPWGSYRCPTCNAEVSLRSGNYRATHFAHKPGQGKPECEEFHPSDDLSHSWRQADPYHGPAIEPLRLSIELEPDYDARRGPRKWGARLTVPKSPDEHGVVQIDCGGGDVRKITLSKLFLGSQTYRVDPAAPDFGVSWVSPDVRQPYRSAVEHRIPGLSSRVANVFSAAGGAKLKPQTNVLHWGESYYLIWREGKSIALPSEILVHALATNLGWCCSLVGLPDKADPEIAAWLTQACDLPLARAKREWALLYPPPYAIDDDGTLQVPSASQLFLAIKPIDDEGGDENEITCVVGQYSGSTTLRDTSRHLIEITISDQAAQKPIYLRWDDANLATVSAKSYPDAAHEPTVALKFDGTEATEPVALHRVRCQELLEQVRFGRRRISEIRGHPVLTGSLSWRRADQFEWQKEEIAFAETVGSISLPTGEQRLERINAILQDRSVEIELDFGAYGAFHSFWKAADRTHSKEFKISRDLRARIEWLCKASGGFVMPEHGPLQALDDRSLLRHLFKLPVPSALLAHRRALEHELRDIAKVTAP